MKCRVWSAARSAASSGEKPRPFYIQHASPGADKESNWLPCPDAGTWFVILRMYRPKESVVSAPWKCPPIQKVG
jgi:hypothetical protein